MVHKTEVNLQDAFAGESQANRRYIFFAAKAEKDGFPQVAKLFRAAADAETIHARNHYQVMDAIGTTADNLLAAVLGEHQEYTGMYPIFIEDAQADRNERARQSFTWANKVEEVHHGYFKQALDMVKAGETPEDAEYWVCQRCGNTVTQQPGEPCPICGAKPEMFRKVD